jgi:DNA polymerase V
LDSKYNLIVDYVINCVYKKNKIGTLMNLLLPFYLHKAGAGFPSPATDYIEEDIDLNIHLIKNAPATFVIRVQGKSMSGVGIYDGDLLIVDKSLKPKNLSTVIANVNDELVVKSFIKEKNIQFLSSGSKNFDDKIIINLNSDIFIWGIVTYVIHSTY